MVAIAWMPSRLATYASWVAAPFAARRREIAIFSCHSQRRRLRSTHERASRTGDVGGVAGYRPAPGAHRSRSGDSDRSRTDRIEPDRRDPGLYRRFLPLRRGARGAATGADHTVSDV